MRVEAQPARAAAAVGLLRGRGSGSPLMVVEAARSPNHGALALVKRF